ncbi:MAG: hypothetical protein RLZZ546_987 [Bacteroidota bacterium]
MKKIAVLTSRFPYPLDRGDKLRIFHQIKSLSESYDVSLYSVSREKVDERQIEKLQPYCSKILVHKLSIWEQIFGLLLSLMKKWPFQVGIHFSASFKKILEKDINQSNIDFVYCQLIRMAPFCTHLKHFKIIDYMDAFGLSMKKRSEISSFLFKWIYKWESKLVMAYEKRISKYFDKLTFITQKDAAATLDDAHDLQKSTIISNGIDLDFFASIENNFYSKFDVGFIGNLGYLPNVEAVKMLCNEIANCYEATYGKPLSILVGGARPSEDILKLESNNITIVDGYSDIRDAYRSIKLLCAPIKSGTGQQNKVLEAIGMNIPVICSQEVKSTLDIDGIIVAFSIKDYVMEINKILSDEKLYTDTKQKAFNSLNKNYKWCDANKRLTALFSN